MGNLLSIQKRVFPGKGDPTARQKLETGGFQVRDIYATYTDDNFDTSWLNLFPASWRVVDKGIQPAISLMSK